MEKEFKCKVCGKVINEIDFIASLLKFREGCCADCQEVLYLQLLAIEHWDRFKKAEYNNPIENNNYSDDKSIIRKNGSIVTTRTLEPYDDEYQIEGRSAFAKQIIDEIGRARRFLYEDIGPYFEILESMFNKSNCFWENTGNIMYYIKNSIVSYIVIHLKEYLDNNSKKHSHSIYKFRNNLINDRKSLFEGHVVFKVTTFRKSKDQMKTSFDSFPVSEYLKRLDAVLLKNKTLIDTIDDYRDNVFAHTSKLISKEESEKNFTFLNLRKIYNSLKIIYDSLFYLIAPDKYTNLEYNFNLDFDHLNRISKFYQKNRNNL